MNNLKIGTRLGGGFGLVLLMMTALIVIGVLQLTHISTIVGSLVQEDWVKEEQANVISSNARENNNLVLELFVFRDEASLERIRQGMETHKKNISSAIEVLDKLITRPDGIQLLEKLKESRAAYVATFSKVDQLLVTGKKDEAVKLMQSETEPALSAYMEKTDQLEQLFKNIVDTNGVEIRHTVETTAQTMIGIGIAAILIGLAFAYAVTQSITRPIVYAVKIAQTVAAGDLSGDIEVGSADETGQLIQALKDMNEKLAGIVNQVRAGTDTIATASNQIATGNLDLSSRTEEQASSLEETASSMEELTSTVKQNADNARQASQLAVSASNVALKGGQVVSQVIGTMGSINESAKKIVDIIGVIDSIAFQTNILALNAAVESARAGEQGRGFAVVASEVRNLAQRSAAAAKEIKALINDSVERVDVGTNLVNQAGITMDEVVQSVKRVTEIISEITTATLEQSSGIEQINQAIMQMDQVTQQNAALVEEAAAAAQSMEDQSRNLVDSVSVFKLERIHSPKVTAINNFSRPVQREEVKADLNTKKQFAQTNIHVKRLPSRRVMGSTAANVASDSWEEF